MDKNNIILRIGVLYPDRMRINGDYGNLLILANRCRWRGIKIETQSISLGDPLDPTYFDLLLFGGGQDWRMQTFVADDLKKGKEEVLQQAAAEKTVMLLTGGGYQLCGKFFEAAQGARIPGVNLLDAWTIDNDEVMSGDIIIESDWLTPNTLVGFESHSGKTYLGPNGRPMGRRIIGQGNNGEDAFEGCRTDHIFGTYLHGPILPRNPHFTDYLIHLALKRRYDEVPLVPLDDELEWEAHQRVLDQAGR
jgi:lipid II isoglutaminyl synthase (glutamine-hydrolysing)